MSKKVLILSGIPASGKSTYAKNLIDKNPGMYKRVNKDDLRELIDNGKWSKDNEKFILKIRDNIIIEALKSGKHVVVDDTNLSPKHGEHIKELVKGLAEVETKFFDITVEEAVKRDLQRSNSVGRDVIENMYNQFLKPRAQVYKPNKDKPSAFIFDIDGTLALKGDRGIFDWEKVGDDMVNNPVADILRLISLSGHKIIIFTGRDGCCEEQTKEWLKTHNIFYDYFDIRPEGNTEKDYIIKKRMFDKIKDNYNIVGVFDDRKQVKRMWVDMGLFVFDVNQNDIEF